MRYRLSNEKKFLYQWDLNQKIILTDVPENVEIHFAHSTDKEALVCSTYSNNDNTFVDIPNILLQSDETIYMYTVQIRGNEQFTIQANSIGVVRREKPSDYVYINDEMFYDVKEIYNEIKSLKDIVVNSLIQDAIINSNGDLIITLADGTEINAGYAIGPQGEKGDKGDSGKDGNDYILTDNDKQEIAVMIENLDFQVLDLTKDVSLSTLESGAYQVTAEGYVTTPCKDRHWVSKDGLIFIRIRNVTGQFDCFIADSSPKLISYIDSELKVTELRYLYDYIPITEFIFGFIEETLPNEYAKKTEIPTKTSQLENDSGFLTEHQDISHLQERLSDEQLSNIADIPNKVSADYVNTAIQTAITDVLGGAS